MKPFLFVHLLSSRLGVEAATVSQLDRVLADNDLRRRGSGRAVPDVNRREALFLLLAIATATTAGRAHRDALAWANLRALEVAGHEPSFSWDEAIHLSDDRLIGISLIELLDTLCELLHSQSLDAPRVNLILNTSQNEAVVSIASNALIKNDVTFGDPDFHQRQRDPLLVRSVLVKGGALALIGRYCGRSET